MNKNEGECKMNVAMLLSKDDYVCILVVLLFVCLY